MCGMFELNSGYFVALPIDALPYLEIGEANFKGAL